MNSDNEPRYDIANAPFKRGYKWVDWNKVPNEIKSNKALVLPEEYENFIPTEVIILLLKAFQNDTGLIGKIMQEEIYSKNMSNRHLDIIEKLIGVVGSK